MLYRSLVISEKDAAQVLGVNRVSIRNWIRNGNLRCSTPKNSTPKILLSSVEKMIGCRICLRTLEEVPNLRQCEKCTLDCPRAGLTLRGKRGEVKTVITYVCHLLTDFSPPRVEKAVAVLRDLNKVLDREVKKPKEKKKRKRRKKR